MTPMWLRSRYWQMRRLRRFAQRHIAENLELHQALGRIEDKEGNHD